MRTLTACVGIALDALMSYPELLRVFVKSMLLDALEEAVSCIAILQYIDIPLEELK